MEEKTWVISKKGEKLSCMRLIVEATFIGLIGYFYFVGLRFPNIVDVLFYLSIIFIDLLIFLVSKSIDNWENPKIIKIKNNEITIEEKFPDGEVKRQVVYIDGIYKITIKRRKTVIEYRIPDGTEFIWRLIRPGYVKEDREKLQEVLNEILKRIDRDKVEVIRGR